MTDLPWDAGTTPATLNGAKGLRCVVCLRDLPPLYRLYCSERCRWVIRRTSTRPLLRTPEERFWGKVTARTKDECWLWTGKHDRRGYGRVMQARRVLQAHRVAWMLAHGPIPDGLNVCHTCDNPPCVNPVHLFLGTDADNAHDRDAKGRTSRGEAHLAHLTVRRGEQLSRLTDEQVAEIRRGYSGQFGQQADLARLYGVHPSVISRIVKRKGWTHV